MIKIIERLLNRKEKIQNNFLDTHIEEYLLEHFNHAKANEISSGRTIILEGYRALPLQEKTHINPLFISLDEKQLTNLENRIIEGKLYTLTNDNTSYIYGNLKDNGVLFIETEKIIPIQLFLDNTDVLKLQSMGITKEYNAKPIYDAVREGDLLKGTYYDPPKTNHTWHVVGENSLWPSSIGQITLKPTYDAVRKILRL